MPKNVTVLIADDHPLLRKGLRAAIQDDAGITIVAEVGDGDAALNSLQELTPDVAVLDIDMPKLDGFGVARKMQDLGLTTRIIFLTLHTDGDIFDAAMELGATGYILKDSAMEEIALGVRAVADGRTYLSSAMTNRLLSQRLQPPARLKENAFAKLLTPSEWQILRLISAGLSSKEIAAQIGIHYRTVENHRTNMCKKLGLEGANALVRFALQKRADLDFV